MSQPALAKIERGVTLPRYDTLERLARACDRQLALTSPAWNVDPQDWAQAKSILKRTPEERLCDIETAGNAVLSLRRAGKRSRSAHAG